jgi:cell division protein FtsB|tara:strand:- start:160 stop:459 length:300 start_codon:yes stop_codon:yes gene_type:complete
MIKIQRLALTFILIASTGLVIHTIFFSEGWDKSAELQREVEERLDANEALKTEAEQLRSDIKAIREQPEVQERIVRDELGYLRSGEIILELNQKNRKTQ